MRFVLTALLFALPTYASAAVVFSEIAWMGTAENFRCEWIELYNNGTTPVDLGEWTLQIGAGGTQRVFSSGIYQSLVVQPGDHFVIERQVESCPDPVSNSDDLRLAFGDIPNTGENTLLILSSPDGEADRVSGNTDWEAENMGNNTTKETAQKTASGWITAIATPGEAYEGGSTQDQTDNDETDEEEERVSKKSAASDPVVIELQVPDVSLLLRPLFPDIAYVNQNVVFDVEATGIGKTMLDSLTYEWNFGDLQTQTGKKTTHTYRYPGEYVVTVYGTYGRHEQVVRKTITVLPVTFSVSRSADGDVLLSNNAKYEVNVSGFTLRGEKSVTFPKRSIILANGTITIPRSQIGDTEVVVLRDQKKKVVATSYDQKLALLSSVTNAVPVSTDGGIEDHTALEAQENAPQSNFSFANKVSESATTATSGALALLSQAALGQKLPLKQETLPLLALAGIVTVAIIAVLFGKKRNG